MRRAHVTHARRRRGGYVVGCCEATNANNDMMVMHVVHEHGESTRILMNDTETSSASDCKRLARVPRVKRKMCGTRFCASASKNSNLCGQVCGTASA